MRRRRFLHLSALAAAAAATARRAASLTADTPDPTHIKHVLLVTKCHLDVGFTDTQAAVMRKYFDVFYPQAIATAAELRQQGPDHYTWTTGSWLLYEYLEQATPAQRRAIEAAISAGDITWHALPFSWQTEMLDRSMIEGALGLSQSLDARFGRKTIGAKMSDVPGHSRGIIAPLAAAGVRLLDIGINAASTPPEVPGVFLWQDPTGASLAMLYHRHDYGSTLPIPGTDVAVSVEVRNDNNGPHTLPEIAAMYAKLRAQFPNAEVHASDLNEVALAVDRVRDTLPVVTGEIGDTWIYGIPSDPSKVARYRELARLRQEWLRAGRFRTGDATDRQLLRRLLLAVEHTWGTDTKSYLDNDHYRPADLAQAEAATLPGYAKMETSWKEKRDDITVSVKSLPSSLRTEAEHHLAALTVSTPPSLAGASLWPAEKPFASTHFTLAIDPRTGAIVHLESRGTHRNWASPTHPLALFTYQTLSPEQFDAFIAEYITIKADWAPRDFGKPGIARFDAEARDYHPTLSRISALRGKAEDRLLLELATTDAITGAQRENTAPPSQLFLELTLPHADSRIDLRLVALGKRANRLPEAMWLTFAPPDTPRKGWLLDKVGQPVSPSDVLEGGGRSMHAVSDSIRYGDRAGSLTITTLDAPVVALGARSPLDFSRDLPGMRDGIHISLFNNAWGTNYPQWASGDWSYCFTLRA